MKRQNNWSREETKDCYSNKFIDDVFKKYEGETILVPEKFKPSQEFLTYRNDVIFRSDSMYFPHMKQHQLQVMNLDQYIAKIVS